MKKLLFPIVFDAKHNLDEAYCREILLHIHYNYLTTTYCITYDYTIYTYYYYTQLTPTHLLYDNVLDETCVCVCEHFCSRKLKKKNCVEKLKKRKEMRIHIYILYIIH